MPAAVFTPPSITPGELARYDALCAQHASVCAQLDAKYADVAALLVQEGQLANDLVHIQIDGDNAGMGQHNLSFVAADPIIAAAVTPLQRFSGPVGEMNVSAVTSIAASASAMHASVRNVLARIVKP